MSLLEMIIAVIIVGVLTVYSNYVFTFFSIIPSWIMTLVLFALAIDIVLFVIHRK